MENEERNISHEQREKEVFNFFNGVISEMGIIYLKNDKGIDIIPLRIQMIIIFSLIDICASYWYEYKGVNDSPRNRFVSWYENFCRTRDNKEYKDKLEWSEISGNRIYDLRSSLVHFFGMSEFKERIHLALAPNILSTSELKEMEVKINKSERSLIIKSHDFNKLVKDGATIMLESWVEIIKQANGGDHDKKGVHIDGVERIWKKIQKEGAIQIKTVQ